MDPGLRRDDGNGGRCCAWESLISFKSPFLGLFLPNIAYDGNARKYWHLILFPQR
jgi:hypothetical protein